MTKRNRELEHLARARRDAVIMQRMSGREGPDWPRASVARVSPISPLSRIETVLYGKDQMRQWIDGNAGLQVDGKLHPWVHIRWRDAHDPVHSFEFIDTAKWNAGKRWPGFMEWLYR